jgi:hypothetical protein
VASLKPVLQALVVADHVYEDRAGKKIIAGTFNTFGFRTKLPHQDVQRPGAEKKKIRLGDTRPGSPFAYVSLTDACEGAVLTIQFVDLTRNAVLFGNEVTITKVERLSAIELVLPLPELPICAEGIYALEVVCEGEILGSYRITAKNLDEAEAEEV